MMFGKTPIWWRIGIGIVFLAIAIHAGRQSFAYAFRATAPKQALMASPNDGYALALSGEVVLAEKGEGALNDPATLKKVHDLASSALRYAPLDARAMRLLAITDRTAGADTKAADRMALALKITRRDLGAQIWVIEDAVRRDDLNAVLEHYDMVLRFSPTGQKLLFPIMTKAVADPRIQAAMIPYFKNQAPWVVPFVESALANDAALVPLANMVMSAGGLNGTNARLNEYQLVDRLVKTGQFSVAKAIYGSMTGEDQSLLHSPALTVNSLGNQDNPLTWQMSARGENGATPYSGSKENEMGLKIFAGYGSRGVVAQKLLFLSPGNYNLAVTNGAVTESPAATLQLVVRCGDKSAAIAGGAGPASPLVADQTLRLNFAVPANCTSQFLEIIMSGGDNSSGAEAEINRIAFLPGKEPPAKTGA